MSKTMIEESSTNKPQLWLRTSAMGNLEDHIQENLSLYRSGTFTFSPSDTSEIAGISAVPADIATQMKGSSKTEAEDGILLYEALQGLTPQMAAEMRLWTYLAHTTFLDYIRKRFPLPEDEQKAIKQVRRRWFKLGPAMRNALYSLWWGVHLTIDESKEGDEKYHLTRILMSNYSLRTTWLTVILRIPNVLKGILTFYEKYQKELGAVELPLRFLSSYFNRIGGGSLLTMLSIDEVVELCEKQLETLKSIHSREDLYNAYRKLGGSSEEEADNSEDEELEYE